VVFSRARGLIGHAPRPEAIAQEREEVGAAGEVVAGRA
jgi:hypothetical protein